MNWPRCFLILFIAVVTTSMLVAQSPVVQRHQSAADKIVKEALGSNTSMDNLTDLCTKVGNRISGSPQSA